MLISDFDFHLPPELIAQEPLADRSASRLLHLDRRTGEYEDRKFAEFPALVRPSDLLVLNNSRVFPARLFGRRSGLRSQPLSPRNPASRQFLTGEVEVLLTRRLDEWTWQALVRPGRKLAIGEKITFSPELQAEITGRGDYGERTLRFQPVADMFCLLEKLGHVPLPPYIGREDRPEDRERYQTVYARNLGSIAAPTAGLHFTPEILDQLRHKGVEIAEITLHVGLGTFQPVHVDKIEEHKMHREAFTIPEQAAEQINRALQEKRRVVAVGTTTVRTLEYAALQGSDGRISSGSGEADLYIYPGFEFRVISALLTNFHLPRSTLLMLVSAFAGREILRAYEHAVQDRYRFFSYGDCMLIE